MVSSEEIKAFLHQISQDVEIKELFATIPEGTTVPFRKSETDRFFATSFAMRHETVTLEKVTQVCQRIAHRFVEEGYAKDLKAVDVLVCSQNGEDIERVLRFSVFSEVFDNIPYLPPEKCLQSEPVPGIWCSWYTDGSSIPKK